MLIKVFGAAVQGIDATLITIEVNSSRGCMFYSRRLAGLCCQGKPPTHHFRTASKRLPDAYQQYRHQHGTG